MRVTAWIDRCRAGGLLAIVLSLAPGCAQSPGSASAARFVDVTEEVGIDFFFDRWSDAYFMPDSLNAGCALLDYDTDGDLDVYVVNGLYLDDSTRHARGANRLYRQESDGRFVDVTDASGAGDPGYGMGVAVGDIDNDGDPDLYLTNYGPDALYRNNGDGTFTDVTAASGIDNPRWAASAGFFDYDTDGDLDLFVTNYVDFDPSLRVKDVAGRPEFPGPRCCPPAPDLLYRNDGDGTFTDVSELSGIGRVAGRGLGVGLIDLDRDGLLDIYVANDRENNFAWIQTETGVFQDRAVPMGLAVNLYGGAEASMGVAIGDVDGDLGNDLFLSHLYQETNTLYLSEAGGTYADATLGSGLGHPSVDFTGFGTALLDFDLDGDLDLLVVNGRVLRSKPRPGSKVAPHWIPYAEENQLFVNEGSAVFRDAAGICGPLCSTVEVSRGLAIGDIDNDGDPDVLTTSGDGHVRLYRNTGPGSAHWLELRVLERGRDAYGATVILEEGGRAHRRDVIAASSYLSSGDPRVRFGLGESEKIDVLRVRWTDGATELFDVPEIDRIHVLARGTGRPVPAIRDRKP